MANLLKRKLDRMINNPVAKLFKNKGYDQDTDARKAQISFYKLLMILAYADETINENEINLLKDYFYESCITEEEWREIDYYGMHKPKRNEIHDILDNVLIQIRKSKDKDEFINSLKEIINADNILNDEENEIITLLTNQINSLSLISLGSIARRIKNKLNLHHVVMKSDPDAIDYVKNPIAPILSIILGEDKSEDLELSSAKIGLALIVIHSDMGFDDKEKDALKEFIKRLCKIEDDKLNEVFLKLLQIPESYFEMAYLSRIITNSTNETERLELLIDLFNIARANQVYDDYENVYLKLIAQFLFISNGDFLAIRNNITTI